MLFVFIIMLLEALEAENLLLCACDQREQSLLRMLFEILRNSSH